MSNATPPPGPGLPNQAGARHAFRVLGVLSAGAGLVCVVVAGIDFFRAAASFGEPSKFWLSFVGLPLLAVGGWLLQAGYAGVAARYLSGEYAPVVKDSASYLTDGKGILNVGATGQTPAAPGAGVPGSGPYCRSCGTRNDADARFCDSCGTSMA